MRNPLLHFFLIGAAFFGLFSLFDDGVDSSERPLIAVSVQDAQWIAAQFEATWNRSPTATELEGLIDEFIREEIYVREALSLGLDQGDTIVRRRLRQKMEFLTEAGAEAATVQDTELRQFYRANANTYSTAPRIAFAQILLSDEAEIDTLLAELAAGANPAALGQRSLLPQTMEEAVKQVVDGTFGTGFFDAVADLNTGQWTGPVVSGFGPHLVRLDEKRDGSLIPFEDIRDRVELDWRAQKAAELRTVRFEQLRDQYAIERPQPELVLDK